MIEILENCTDIWCWIDSKGRPQSICSSVCPSPQSHLSSPILKKHTDYKRGLITSSPLYSGSQPIQQQAYQTSSIVTTQVHSSSSSSSSPSSSSTSSVIVKQSVTPIKSCGQQQQQQQPILLSSLSAAKRNLDSALLISTQTQVKSQQKLTQRIAHELSKFRISTQIDDKDDDLHVMGSNLNQEEDEDDDDEEDLSHGIIVKPSPCVSNGNNLKQMNSAGLSNSNKSSNEIWLEYGCIWMYKSLNYFDSNLFLFKALVFIRFKSSLAFVCFILSQQPTHQIVNCFFFVVLFRHTYWMNLHQIEEDNFIFCKYICKTLFI